MDEPPVKKTYICCFSYTCDDVFFHILQKRNLLQLGSMMFSLSCSLLESQEEQILCVVSPLPSKETCQGQEV